MPLRFLATSHMLVPLCLRSLKSGAATDRPLSCAPDLGLGYRRSSVRASLAPLRATSLPDSPNNSDSGARNLLIPTSAVRKSGTPRNVLSLGWSLLAPMDVCLTVRMHSNLPVFSHSEHEAAPSSILSRVSGRLRHLR
ncbi:hypothetical protein DFH06DRAFT_751996 [Mycena polygramma]|nr:hypothetical protein DFH06DRAFT_751996 [Mycena polygramma]